MDDGERTGGVQEVERESLCCGLDTLCLGILNFPKDWVVGENAGGGGIIGEGVVLGGENWGGGGMMDGGEEDWESWGLSDSFWSLTSTPPKLAPGCDAMVLVVVFCFLLGFGIGSIGTSGLSPTIPGRGDG